MSEINLKPLWQVSALLRSDLNQDAQPFKGLIWANDEDEIRAILNNKARNFWIERGVYDPDAKVVNAHLNKALGMP